MWLDIPYMDQYIDFTVDDENFPGLKEKVDELHSKNMRFVPIIDAGISVNKPEFVDKDYFTKGVEAEIFLKSAQNNHETYGDTLMAQVWPGLTSFVDYMADGSDEFWAEGLEDFFNLVEFDGIWLDMNDPTNFCDFGECPNASPEPYDPDDPDPIPGLFFDRYGTNTTVPKDDPIGQDDSKYNALSWWPGDDPLYQKTISMDAYHWKKEQDPTLEFYNTHSLFATLETRSRLDQLESIWTPMSLKRSKARPRDHLFSPDHHSQAMANTVKSGLETMMQTWNR